MESTKAGRRLFLKNGAALAGMAMGSAGRGTYKNYYRFGLTELKVHAQRRTLAS